MEMAAKSIGVILDIPVERIAQIGNAAIEGATMARRIQQGRLKKHLQSFDFLADGRRFQPVKSNRQVAP